MKIISSYKISFFKYSSVLFFLLLFECKKAPVQSSPAPPVIPLPPASAATLTARSINVTAHSRGFYEYLPEGYVSDSSNKDYPLIVFFHGGNETGNDASDLSRLLIHGPLKLVKSGSFPTSFTSNGKSFKFIIIAPQFTSSGNTYPNEVDALIEYAKKNYKVDASRIYLTGLSYGAGLMWSYVGENINYANKIAAMVPIASYIHDARDEFKVTAEKAQRIATANLAIWSTHNSGDGVCPIKWITDALQLIKLSSPAPNPLPRLTIFNSNSHGGWSQTYMPTFKENNLNIYEWMLKHQR